MKASIDQNVKTREIIDQLSVEDLQPILDSKSCVIIDVRPHQDAESIGTLPDSVSIPYEIIDKALEDKHEAFSDPRPKLFYCTGGVMSYGAALKAQEKGLTNLINLEGGFSAWSNYHTNQ